MSLNRLVLLLLALILLIALYFFVFAPTPPPPDPLADYGDAPDPDQSMDTGYYAPVPVAGAPLVMVYMNAGIDAQFPTDLVGPPGPYTLDVDNFWIGPIATPPFLIVPGIGLVPGAAPNPADIPSVEAGPYDPADPDGPSNLEEIPPSTATTKADCDKENSTHMPQIGAGLNGGICNPVPPYTIGMNGRLFIVVGNPPLALFMTRIWFNVGGADMEGVYWNALFDTDQSGEWNSGPGRDEWPARDILVPIMPPSRLVISPAFEWGSSGNPFGRLLFPVWARSMVTDTRVADAVPVAPNDYHGEGPAGGFAMGEVEDYFIEWTPIGQMLGAGGPGGGPGGPGGGGGGGDADANREGLSEDLTSFEGPDAVPVGEAVRFVVSNGTGVSIVCLPHDSGGPVEAFDLSNDGLEIPICGGYEAEATASFAESAVTVNVETGPDGLTLLLVGSKGAEKDLGTGQVPVHGAKLVRLTR